MSNDKSIITNLVNKVSYKLQKASYDPEADAYAEKKEEKKEIAPDTTDPNTFNKRRFANKVYDQFTNTFKICIWPFIAIMSAMIVANEMIIYPVPMRIIFFIFTIILIMLNSIAAVLLPIFYILKGGYSYYINNMKNGKKQRIIPKIYALLPIMEYKETSYLKSLLLYPFSYPKTDSELPEITNDYWKSLIESFKGYDKIKDLPVFVNDIKNAKKSLSKLYEIAPEPLEPLKPLEPSEPSSESSEPLEPSEPIKNINIK